MTFAWSFCVVILLILDAALRQRLVPDAYLGRVSATSRFISWGVDPAGALIGGALGASALGLRATLAVAAAGIALSGLWPLLASASTIATAAPPPAGVPDEGPGGPMACERQGTS
jgi:hypothetical protein